MQATEDEGDEVPPRQLYGDLPAPLPSHEQFRLQILADRERSAATERRRAAKQQAAIQRRQAHKGGNIKQARPGARPA